MNTSTSALATILSLLALGSMSSAQTVFTDADGANSYISNAGNWSAGLPTGGTSGTIPIDAKYDSIISHDGYDVVHTAGTLKRGSGSSGLALGAGTTWEMNGATAQISLTRGISVNGATFSLNQGTADLTDNNRDCSISGGGLVTINGGTMDIGRYFYLINGALVVNGGSLLNIQDLGSRNFHTGGNADFNGGAITATYLTFGTAGFDVNFGGTTAGSLTIENFGGGRANVNLIDIDFDPGTLMSMQLTNPVESGASGDGDLGWSKVGSETGLDWAPALWANGRLTYNEQDYTTLGDWAAVTSPGGLGNGTHFVFEDNTLSLAVTSSGGTVITIR